MSRPTLSTRTFKVRTSACTRSYGYNNTSYAHNSCGFIVQEVLEVYLEATLVIEGNFDQDRLEVDDEHESPIAFHDKVVVVKERLYQLHLAAFQHNSQTKITALETRINTLNEALDAIDSFSNNIHLELFFSTPRTCSICAQHSRPLSPLRGRSLSRSPRDPS